MIGVNYIYESCGALISKAQGGGYFSAANFNAYANMASIEFFNNEFAIFQDTQEITDNITPHLLNIILSVDSKGDVDYPSDYAYLAALRTYNIEDYLAIKTTCEANNKPIDYDAVRQVTVKVLDNDKIGKRMKSNLFRPTNELPVAILYNGYIQCYPIDLGVLIMDYFKYPVAPVWGFTVVNGLQVYDPTTSTDFDWNPISANRLISLICRNFGIEVREDELIKDMMLIEKSQP